MSLTLPSLQRNYLVTTHSGLMANNSMVELHFWLLRNLQIRTLYKMISMQIRLLN